MIKLEIFGTRAILEAIESGKSIQKIYLQKGLKGSLFSELEKKIKQENLSISYVPVEKLDRLSKNNNHQGAVAIISPIEFHDLNSTVESALQKNKNPLFLLLDRISDVRNFGAIIRSAECTGVDAIIIPQSGNAPVNAESIKTSAGAAYKIPICKVNHIKDAIFTLQSHNIKIVAATEKTDSSIYDVPMSEGIAIIMGSEDKGIHLSILKLADYKARIPLYGKIESLNVSVACGVFLYEAVRQRNF